MDRRYLRTEQLLHSAMLELISDRPFHAITVQMIVERAQVAKKTFYAHYENKLELLWASLEAHYQALEAGTGSLSPESLLMDNKPLSYPVFKHVETYAVFYRSMLLDEGEGGIVHRFFDYLAEQSLAKHAPLRAFAPQETVPAELIANMLAGGLVGALRWWLRSGLEDSAEEMAYRFSQIMAPGVMQSLGLDF